jgi:hypothetical protein
MPKVKCFDLEVPSQDASDPRTYRPAHVVLSRHEPDCEPSPSEEIRVVWGKFRANCSAVECVLQDWLRSRGTLIPGFRPPLIRFAVQLLGRQSADVSFRFGEG